MKAVVVYIDGGSRGNPGPAGYGVRVEDHEGRLIAELHGRLGVTTNNVAEYKGLLAALAFLVRCHHRVARIRSDSELLVRQMRGEYRVKNETLRGLFLEASGLARQIGLVTYTAVRREANELADRLVNEALDQASY